MIVADVMTRNCVTIAPEATVEDAVHLIGNVKRAERVDLLRTRCRAANIHASHCLIA